MITRRGFISSSALALPLGLLSKPVSLLDVHLFHAPFLVRDLAPGASLQTRLILNRPFAVRGEWILGRLPVLLPPEMCLTLVKIQRDSGGRLCVTVRAAPIQ